MTENKKEATHMSDRDIETVKNCAEISDTVKSYRKEQKKNGSRFGRDVMGAAATILAGLTVAAGVNDKEDDNKVIPLSTAAAMSSNRRELEKETKCIEETNASKNNRIDKNEGTRNFLTVGEAITGVMMGIGVLVSNPVATLAYASLLLGAEVAKKGLAKSERRELETCLGRHMPEKYRMFKHKER